MMTEHKFFLIIDDDAEDGEFFCEAVAELDPSFDCYQALNAEDALAQLRQKQIPLPDYIFLDLNMPRMNGREFLQEIKNDPALRSVPVIIYTTSSAQKDKDETRALGADYFLTKPSEFKGISSAVADIMQLLAAANK